MWDRKELKAQGKAAFRANYWKCVVVSIIMGMLTGATASVSYNNANQQQVEQQAQGVVNQIQAMTPQQQMGLALAIASGMTLIITISVLLRIFVFNPLEVGCFSFFKENVQDAPADFGSIGIGFGNYGHTFVTLFLRDLFLALWTCLFIIPGFIKSYSYRMVPFILVDEPDLTAMETIQRSKDMMNGHKWNAFILDLSFIGWALLTILTLGLVGIFWYNPYKYNTDAALYLALRDQNR